ncbi:MAG TPA: Asp-tRNA(Asn)/Glu-tRNA(Gln) amidotransferase GatCAB subunit B, partial [Burkholderiales bacterium]
PLVIADSWIDEVEAQLAKIGTPESKRAQFTLEYGSSLTPYDTVLLTESREKSEFFERMVARLGASSAKLCANWVSGELAAALKRENLDVSESRITADQLATLLTRVADNTLSGKMAKEVFDAMWAGEGAADAIIEKRGLKQITDAGEIERIVDEVLAANARQVEDYRAGKEKAFNSLVGQAMKATRGKGNPATINELLRKKLGR